MKTFPLYEIQRQMGDVTYREYGPGSDQGTTDISGDISGQSVEIAESFGAYEGEYAAIRKGIGVMDWPQSGLIELTGSDRSDFLHRMITQEVRALKPGQLNRGFLLNKAGRVISDLLVLQGQSRTWLVLDRFDSPAVVAELEKYLFSEDVQIKNVSDQHVRMTLFGPGAAKTLMALSDLAEPPDAMHHVEAPLAGAGCVLYRYDETGSPGLHVVTGRDDAAHVYQSILENVRAGLRHPEQRAEGSAGPQPEVEPVRFRGMIGWEAYNTARIEAGHPRYHIDFGPDSLPHETGVIQEAVSFTKGCYLGQEIVARMQSLGHPKRVLVGLKVGAPLLPIAGSEVFAPGNGGDGPGKDGATPTEDRGPVGPVVGAVTSSTISPMLGGDAIAFAMVKWGHHTVGTQLVVAAQGRLIGAKVHALRFVG